MTENKKLKMLSIDITGYVKDSENELKKGFFIYKHTDNLVTQPSGHNRAGTESNLKF